MLELTLKNKLAGRNNVPIAPALKKMDHADRALAVLGNQIYSNKSNSNVVSSNNDESHVALAAVSSSPEHKKETRSMSMDTTIVTSKGSNQQHSSTSDGTFFLY